MLEYWAWALGSSATLFAGMIAFGVKRHLDEDRDTRNKVLGNHTSLKQFRGEFGEFKRSALRNDMRMEGKLDAHAEEVRDGLKEQRSLTNKVLLGLAKLNGGGK